MGKPELPFSLDLRQRARNGVTRGALFAVEPLVERAFALTALNREYRSILDDPRDMEFVSKALDTLGVSYALSPEALERIPSAGPAIIVANHPFGGIEGVILAELLSKRRPDGKIMANFLLQRITELRKHFIFVDPFGGSDAAKSNYPALRHSLAHLRQGGLLAIFPSGTVSHFNFRRREVTDPEWSTTVARIARQSNAPVIPMFFEGTNGLLFQLAGLVHPLLRTALIPRELYNKRNSEIRVKIGSPITAEKVASFSNDQELVAYMRLRTYILDRPKATRVQAPRPQEPLIDAVEPDLLEQEIAALPSSQTLVESGDFSVHYARAAQIPHTLREIGRLREASFRLVQEGTGRSVDIDRFDNYYVHLFVWNRSRRELVGAYRLVKTDTVLRSYGKRGLYTSTLFAYRSQLLTQIGPALELGRSFVRPEYQKNYNSLHLLWRGIGLYVAQNPRYHVLFGTVSISSEYDSLSRQLIASFLKANRYLPELAKMIRARNPMTLSVLAADADASSVVVKDLKEVNELIAEIELKHKSIPVLLKQYLRLGGHLLGFNVDPNFGNVLDGLIYVDLLETDRKILERYMGRECAEQFLAAHGCREGNRRTVSAI